MLTQRDVALGDVRPHPRNARQGNVEAIVASLQEHGQYRPIVVNERTMEILAGNHTWQAAGRLGWPTITATFVDVDDEQALRILLVDNRLNDVAGYDDAQLVELLDALAATDAGLTGTGFTDADLAKLLSKQTEDAADLTRQMSELEYRVLVECDGEAQQRLLIERFEADGLVVRALIS